MKILGFTRDYNLLPFLKSVSSAIIRECNEYLYFYQLYRQFERFAGLGNLTAFLKLVGLRFGSKLKA